MDLTARSIVLLLLAGSVQMDSSVRSAVDHRESLGMFNKPSNVTAAVVERFPLEHERSKVQAKIEPNPESNHRLTSASKLNNNESDGESNVGPEKARSINELEPSKVTSKQPSKESSKNSSKEPSEESSANPETIDGRNGGKPECEDYHFDCVGCLSQKNCVFCWYEKQCVKRRHADYSVESDANGHQKGNPEDNHHPQTPRGMLNESELNALSERDAARLNNNSMLIKPLGTVPKNTCPVRNTLSNISASSCAVDELTLLWLMFSSVILSVIVLFGCLFYCCVFRNKAADMIIIASDKDNFVLIDEE